MLQVFQSFAQSSYPYDTTTSTANAGVSSVLIIVYLAIIVVAVVGLWKMFTKAGRPGWAAIVPFYNAWVLAEIAGRPGWFGLLATVISAVPLVGWVAALVMFLLISMDLAVKFGKSKVFGVIGLFLFSLVGYLILGFGSATYDASRKTDTPQIGKPTAGSGTPPASTPPTSTPPVATPPANPTV
jgi:hypothetical protein